MFPGPATESPRRGRGIGLAAELRHPAGVSLPDNRACGGSTQEAPRSVPRCQRLLSYPLPPLRARLEAELGKCPMGGEWLGQVSKGRELREPKMRGQRGEAVPGGTLRNADSEHLDGCV